MKTILKKASLVIAGLSFISLVHATVHTVNVMNFSFSPNSFSATIGDTVKWVWINGGHTTTSTSVPSGAATWSNPMNSSSTTFEYKITTTGTYNYWCAIHTTMMEASFTVTPTGVPVVSASKSIASVFPNPTSNTINFNVLANIRDGLLTIMNITGKEVIKQNLSQQNNAVDVSAWSKGIYLYRIDNNGEMMEGKFEVQ